MPTFQIAIDEFIIVEKGHQLQICTDGLAGCVALVLDGGDRCALTHINSAHDDEEKFLKIRPKLNQMLETVGIPVYATVAHAQVPSRFLRPRVEQWLQIKKARTEPKLEDTGGVIVMYQQGAWTAKKKVSDQEKIVSGQKKIMPGTANMFGPQNKKLADADGTDGVVAFGSLI